MKPKDAYNSFSPVDEAGAMIPSYFSRQGRIPFDKLLDLVEHHSMREVSVSTAHFGLVECPKHRVMHTMKSDYFLRRIERLKQRGPVEVSIAITRVQRVKIDAYRMSIHTIGVWDGETIWVLT